MSVQLLNAILRIKVRLYSQNKCCKNFEITDQMLKDFTSSKLYPYCYEKANEALDELTQEELDVIDELSTAFNVPCLSSPDF